jgi:5-methylcytosine-specific restriction endonuclease McrA
MDTPLDKRCPKCHRLLPRTEYFRNRAQPSGYSVYCKLCDMAAANTRRPRNMPPRLPEGFRRCYVCKAMKPITDFYRNRAQANGYSFACKSCERERAECYRKARLPQYAEYSRANRRRNPEAWKARDKRYRVTNREPLALKRKVYEKTHAPEIRQTKRRYKKRHPEQGADYRARRLAWQKGSPVITKVDRLAIIARDGSRCHICKRLITPKDLTLDHLIPLSKGGPHTPENLACAHRVCNSQRNDGRLPAQLRLFA